MTDELRLERAAYALYIATHATDPEITLTEAQRCWDVETEMHSVYAHRAQAVLDADYDFLRENVPPQTTVDCAVLVIDEYLEQELTDLQAIQVLNECITNLKNRIQQAAKNEKTNNTAA